MNWIYFDQRDQRYVATEDNTHAEVEMNRRWMKSVEGGGECGVRLDYYLERSSDVWLHWRGDAPADPATIALILAIAETP